MSQSTILDFTQMFNNHVAKNQKIWDHDRSSTVGASEVFGCMRKSFFDKRADSLKIEKDPDYENDWGAMERGNIIEEHWVVPVLEGQIPKNTEYLFGSAGQETFVYGANSATPDGLITGLSPDALSLYGIEDIGSGEIMVEIKSFDPRSNFDEEKAIHHGQIQTQMGIVRRMTKFRPLYGVIIYVNASFLSDVRVYVVEYDPDIFKAAQKRAADILAATKPEELRAEGKITDYCKFCPWKHACAKASKEAIPTTVAKATDISDDDEHELRVLAQKAEAASAEEKEAKARKEEYRNAIKDLLAELDTKKVTRDDFSLSWSFQEGKASYDYKAMKEAGINIDEFKSNGVGFERLTVSVGSRKKKAE